MTAKPCRPCSRWFASPLRVRSHIVPTAAFARSRGAFCQWILQGFADDVGTVGWPHPRRVSAMREPRGGSSVDRSLRRVTALRRHASLGGGGWVCTRGSTSVVIPADILGCPPDAGSCRLASSRERRGSVTGSNPVSPTEKPPAIAGSFVCLELVRAISVLCHFGQCAPARS